MSTTVYKFHSPANYLSKHSAVDASDLQEAVRQIYEELQEIPCLDFHYRRKDPLYLDEERGVYHTGRGTSRALRKDQEFGAVGSFLEPITYPLGEAEIAQALKEEWVEGVPEKFQAKLQGKITPLTALVGTGSHPYVGWHDRAQDSLQGVAHSHPSLALECVEIYSGMVVCWVILGHYKRQPKWAA